MQHAFEFDYVTAIRAIRSGSLRDVGLAILNQSDEPVSWFETGADWSAGFAFRQFVIEIKPHVPAGKKPRCMATVDRDGHVTVSTVAGKCACTA